jgi:hypothetical protein
VEEDAIGLEKWKYQGRSNSPSTVLAVRFHKVNTLDLGPRLSRSHTVKREIISAENTRHTKLVSVLIKNSYRHQEKYNNTSRRTPRGNWLARAWVRFPFGKEFRVDPTPARSGGHQRQQPSTHNAQAPPTRDGACRRVENVYIEKKPKNVRFFVCYTVVHQTTTATINYRAN